MFLYLAFCLIALCCCLRVEIPGLFIQNRYIWPAWVWTQNTEIHFMHLKALKNLTSFWMLPSGLVFGSWTDTFPWNSATNNQHHQWILQSSERHPLIPDFIDSIFHWEKAAIICDSSGSTKWKGFVQSSAPRGTLARVAYQPLQRWMANWKHLKTWSGYSNVVPSYKRSLTRFLPTKQIDLVYIWFIIPVPNKPMMKYWKFCSHLSGFIHEQMKRSKRLAGIKTVADVSPVALHLEKTNPNEGE